MLWLLNISACSTSIKAPVSAPATTSQPPAAASTGSQAQGYHVVKKGDTLYSIAWRYGMDFKQVAAWNGIRSPYLIYPEQVIRLKAPPGVVTAAANRPKQPAPATPANNRNQSPPSRTTTPAPASAAPERLDWQWPTSGNLVKINLPTSENGLNISGHVGQEIKAAANGEVVYSGSGLLGYGKLIIIKHNETYLSAYAHNDRILIEEGTKVTIGQDIATMGIGNNGKPLLHFEIRKDGKPVDPMKYLPPRRS